LPSATPAWRIQPLANGPHHDPNAKQRKPNGPQRSHNGPGLPRKICHSQQARRAQRGKRPAPVSEAGVSRPPRKNPATMPSGGDNHSSEPVEEVKHNSSEPIKKNGKATHLKTPFLFSTLHLRHLENFLANLCSRNLQPEPENRFFKEPALHKAWTRHGNLLNALFNMRPLKNLTDEFPITNFDDFLKIHAVWSA